MLFSLALTQEMRSLAFAGGWIKWSARLGQPQKKIECSAATSVTVYGPGSERAGGAPDIFFSRHLHQPTAGSVALGVLGLIQGPHDLYCIGVEY